MSATGSISSTCARRSTGVESAYSFVRDLVADGGTILFVGTKKQTQGPVAEYAEACGMPYVNQRWLGGMLTNFATVSGRVKRMQELRTMQAAGDFEGMPKREALQHTRELEKLSRNLGGIADLDRLPNAVFVIDTKKEHIAVTEARKLGLPGGGRRRHQLRPRRDRLRDPGQRRRHPLGLAHVPGDRRRRGRGPLHRRAPAQDGAAAPEESGPSSAPRPAAGRRAPPAAPRPHPPPPPPRPTAAAAAPAPEPRRGGLSVAGYTAKDVSTLRQMTGAGMLDCQQRARGERAATWRRQPRSCA